MGHTALTTDVLAELVVYIPRVWFARRRTDEWDKSLEYFREAIEIDPLNIALLSESADTFAELRQYTNALKIYDQALEIRPDNPDTLVSKAKIYQSQCNLSEAAKLLAKVVSDPSSEQAFPALIRQKIYERRFPEAIALLNDALERNGGPLLGSQEVDYRATLADVRQFSGDTAGARSTWEEVKVEIERIPASRIYGGWSVTLERRWLAIAYAALVVNSDVPLHLTGMDIVVRSSDCRAFRLSEHYAPALLEILQPRVVAG